MMRVAAQRLTSALRRAGLPSAPLPAALACLQTGRSLAVPAGPPLAHFLPRSDSSSLHEASSSWPEGVSGLAPLAAAAAAAPRSVFVETYGCQMNASDSEVVLSILLSAGYSRVGSAEEANVVLLNTCAIRDKAEERVWQRLKALQHLRRRGRRGREVPPAVVGVLGCMAERLKGKLLEGDRLADLVAGPDAYRDLPRLLAGVLDSGEAAMNVQLSLDETYADVTPLRDAGRAAYLSIMRGCDNHCAFCIVPHTRGRERSRPAASVLDELRILSDRGVREVTLLGQNVNSYADWSEAAQPPPPALRSSDPGAFDSYAPGFRSVYVPRREGALRFAELLDAAARIDPEMRVRFTSPHPKGKDTPPTTTQCPARSDFPPPPPRMGSFRLPVGAAAGHCQPRQPVQAAPHARAERERRRAGAHATGLRTGCLSGAGGRRQSRAGARHVPVVRLHQRLLRRDGGGA